MDRRQPLRGWEQRIAGDARGAPPHIESSKDSDFLIGGASYRADRALLNRRTSEAVGSCPAVIPRPGWGMATIRDKMGHCLHEFFTMGKSQQRYAKFRGDGRASAVRQSDFRVSQSTVCATRGKCRVSQHFLYINMYVVLHNVKLYSFKCIPHGVASVSRTSSRASRPDVVRDDEGQAELRC